MLEKLFLNNFRSYEKIELNFSGKSAVIYGENGSGKTNILEAISLLSPGNGLRNSIANVHKYGSKYFSIQANIENEEKHNIKVFFLSEKKKREILINNIKINNQLELLNVANIIWLTPQIEKNFSHRSFRLRYLDRMISNYCHTHAQNLLLYYKAKKKRQELLAENKNYILLEGVERLMSKYSVAIDQKRCDFLQEIQLLTESTLIKNINFALKTKPSNYLNKSVDYLQGIMFKNPSQDKKYLQTHGGCHLSEWHISQSNIDYCYLSTGEQKSVMLSIIMILMQKKSCHQNILLLDEITAHLDENKKNFFLNYLLKTKHQFILTGTNKGSFDLLKDKINFISL